MEKLLIYVTVGTSHYRFDRMLQKSNELLNSLQMDFEVVLQFGSSNKIPFKNCIESADFFSREKSEYLYQNADFVFSHTGIGSLFNSLKYNRPTILFTRLEKYNEFSDNHQSQIAQELKMNNLVYIVEEENFKHSSFSTFIEQNINTTKEEVDLTNRDLALFLKSRLYN